MSAASATIGLVAVLTLRMGVLATVPLLVAGAVLMAFFRAYSSLADRHTSLERLFRFSRELNGAPATTDVLPGRPQSGPSAAARRDRRGPPLLARGTTAAPAPVALRRRTRERRLQRGRAGSRWLSRCPSVPAGRPGCSRTDDDDSRAFLRNREAREAVVAPLIVEGETVGRPRRVRPAR